MDLVTYLRVSAEDHEGIRLRGAFKDLRRQLSEAKNMAEVERIDALFRTLQDRVERRASQIAGRVAMGAALSRPRAHNALGWRTRSPIVSPCSASSERPGIGIRR